VENAQNERKKDPPSAGLPDLQTYGALSKARFANQSEARYKHREEKHGAGSMAEEADKAIAMLNLFASVGAQRFDVTFTDIEGRKLSKGGFLPNRHISELRRTVGSLLREGAAAQHNIIIRPRSTRASFIQLDDPPPASIEQGPPLFSFTAPVQPAIRYGLPSTKSPISNSSAASRRAPERTSWRPAPRASPAA
jgi:hypothetical protein